MNALALFDIAPLAPPTVVIVSCNLPLQASQPRGLPLTLALYGPLEPLGAFLTSRPSGLLPLPLSSRLCWQKPCRDNLFATQFLSTLGQSLLFVHQCVLSNDAVVPFWPMLSKIVLFSFRLPVFHNWFNCSFFVSTFLGLRHGLPVHNLSSFQRWCVRSFS